MKLVHRIVNLCIVIVAICFAILNRDTVEIDLFVVTVEVALFIPVLGALGFGWLWGQFIVALVSGKWRWRARSGERRAARLENEVTTLREKVETVADDGGTGAASEPRLRLADRSRAALNEP